MTNYSNPWREKEARAKQAAELVATARSKYAPAIESCVANTFLHPERRDIERLRVSFYRRHTPSYDMPEIVVVNQDTVSAAFEQKGRVAILNFASYKNPGGMFLNGSIAQEEALCHASNGILFEVLSSEKVFNAFYEQNRKMLNRALYHDNLLYTYDVPFFRGTEMRKCDVITCAAPNKGAAQKYQNVPDAICDRAMRMRIRSLLLATIDEHLSFGEGDGLNCVVLGAFGCGVFKNDPAAVAKMFREELIGFPIKVVFAVPGEKYDIFVDAFSGLC